MAPRCAQQSFAMRRSPPFLLHTKNAIASGILFSPFSACGAIRAFRFSHCSPPGRFRRDYTSSSPSPTSDFNRSVKPIEVWKPPTSTVHSVLPDSKPGGLKGSALQKEEETLHSCVSLAQKDGVIQPSAKCSRRPSPSKVSRDIDGEAKGSSFLLHKNGQVGSKNGSKKKLKISEGSERGLVSSDKIGGDEDDGVDRSSLPLLQSVVHLATRVGSKKNAIDKVFKDSSEDLVESHGLTHDGFEASRPSVKSAQIVSDGARRASRPKVKQKDIEDIVNSSLNVDSECGVEMLRYAESSKSRKTSRAKKVAVPDDQNEKDRTKDSGIQTLETIPLATSAKKRRHVKAQMHEAESSIDANITLPDEVNVSGSISSQKDLLLSSDTGKTTCVKALKEGFTDLNKTNEVKKPELFQSVFEIGSKKEKVQLNLREEKAELKQIPIEADSTISNKFLELEKENEGNFAANKAPACLSDKAEISNNCNGIVEDSGHKENREMTQISDASDKTYETKEKPCDIRGIRNIKVSRRFKKNPEEIVSLLRLHTCSKYGDLHGALELYDEVKRGGTIKPNMSFYSSLLYICSGAASGTLTRSKSGREKKPEGTRSKENGDSVGVMSEESVENNNELIHFSPEDMQLAARRGMEVYEHMLEVQAPFNEAIFTSLSRLAVATGDGDWAFDIVKKMASRGIAPKLRSYGPALLCFCENNDIHKAFEVDKHMEEAGVLPDENILANLLKVSIEAGEEKKVYSLLHRLRKRVRDLSSTTVTTIESWFTGEIASSIGESQNKRLSTEEIRKTIEANGGGWHGLGWLGKGKWEVKRTNLSKEGLCLSCGERLCTIDLDPVETAEFADTIARFACEREHLPNQFKEFQRWLDRNGPYGAILDGANIGLYNPQVFRGFSFKLLSTVMHKAGAKISDEKPSLILLHNRHSTRIAQSISAETTINRWKKEKALYFTPQGSNDDWYWLYAAVKCKCLLVTNDEMRDHIFELLGTDFFPKWKERHQVRFTFSPQGLELHMPPPYSVIIQESEHGSWHIPEVGGDDIDVPREWLCVTRPTC